MYSKLLINLPKKYDAFRNFFSLKETLLSIVKEYSSKIGSEIYFAVSYIKKSGIEEFVSMFKEVLNNGGKIRILTCFDFGFTDIEALEQLNDLRKFGDIKIKIYFEPDINYHPKVYLLKHNAGENALLVGSNNLSLMALEKNIECAILQKNSDIFDDLCYYFSWLWNQANELDFGIEENLSKLYQKAEKQRTNIEREVKKVLVDNELKYALDANGELVKEAFIIIEKFTKMYKITPKILYWRDTAIDEIITLLKASQNSPTLTQRQLIMQLIKDGELHYKSTKAYGSWLNYQLLLQNLGFWDDIGITELGKKAIELYEISFLEFISFIKFCILSSGNLFSLCVAIQKANTKHFSNLNELENLTKDDWIDIILEDVNEYLKELNIEKIGKESLRRYFPGIFNKFGLESFYINYPKNHYQLRFKKMAKYILEYGEKLELVKLKTNDDFVTEL